MANTGKIIFTLTILAMVGSAHLQLLDGYTQAPTGYQQQPLLPLQGGFLSNIMNPNEGLGETIRRLPARGMQMLGNVLTNVRNMIPGLGRNNMNQPNRLDTGFLGQQQYNNNLAQPNLSPLTTPVNNLLQGQQLGQQLTNTVDRLSQGLANPTGNLQNTLNGLTNGQQLPVSPVV